MRIFCFTLLNTKKFKKLERPTNQPTNPPTQFIMTLDASVLNMDEADFNSQLAEAEARLKGKYGE